MQHYIPTAGYRATKSLYKKKTFLFSVFNVFELMFSDDYHSKNIMQKIQKKIKRFIYFISISMPHTKIKNMQHYANLPLSLKCCNTNFFHSFKK